MESAGFVSDPQAHRMCSLAGLATMSGKLAKLEDVKRGILVSIQETKEAKTSLERYSAALLGAKMLKAACDGFISVLAGFTGAAGRIVSGAYQAGSSLADAGTRSALGQHVDVAKTALDVAAGSATAMIGRKGLQYEGFKQSGATERLRQFAEEKSRVLDTVSDLVAAQKVESKIIVDAVRSDEKALWESFGEYTWEIGSLAATGIGDQFSKSFSGLKELVKFHTVLRESIEELKKDLDTRQFDGIVRNFEAQLLRINVAIAALQSQIASCEIELTAAQPVTRLR